MLIFQESLRKHIEKLKKYQSGFECEDEIYDCYQKIIEKQEEELKTLEEVQDYGEYELFAVVCHKGTIDSKKYTFQLN